MPKQEAKVCWDYWECKLEIREKCPAFITKESCWHVAGQYCGRVSGKYGIEKCFACDWYRLNHQHRNGRVINHGL